MSWLKIDDRLFLHPKWLATPTGARALWITALSYCGAQCTDGFVAAPVLMILGGCQEDAEALVKSGLWIEAEGGWNFHNFAEYNKTSEDRRSISEARAEAGRRGAEAKAQQNPSKNLANDEQNLAPGSRIPVPPPPMGEGAGGNPEPCAECSAEVGIAASPAVGTASPGSAKTKSQRGTRIAADFKPRTEDIDAMRAQFPGVETSWLRGETAKFIDYFTAQPGQKGVKLDWYSTWRNWIRTAHERRPSRYGTNGSAPAAQSVPLQSHGAPFRIEAPSAEGIREEQEREVLLSRTMRQAVLDGEAIPYGTQQILRWDSILKDLGEPGLLEPGMPLPRHSEDCFVWSVEKGGFNRVS